MIIRLILLLLGTSSFKFEWKWLALIGAATAAFGAFMAIEACDGQSIFIIDSLGWILFVIGVVELFHFMIAQWDSSAPARLGRAAVFTLLGLIAIFDPDDAACWDAVIIGIIFSGLGIFRIFFSLLGRYPHWRVVLSHGVFNLLLGCLFFWQWEEHEHWLIPLFFGCALTLTGLFTLSTAWNLRNSCLFIEEAGDDIGALDYFIRYHVGLRYRPIFESLPALTKVVHELKEFMRDELNQAKGLFVHIWTPVGSADNPVPSKSAIPLVSRYVMVQDEKGAVSIGHAAMEMKPDLYISHYNRESYDQVMRGEAEIPENVSLIESAKAKNVDGTFFESYSKEVENWKNPNETLNLSRFNEKYLRLFWRYYSKDSTYNLAQKNCSVTVIMALDAAVMGSLRGPKMVLMFFKLLFDKDMWLASFIRKRAEDMVWSPGLVRDYVATLQKVFTRYP
jgi:uncharacterized membrane protein HdeD (DUF308 family)